MIFPVTSPDGDQSVENPAGWRGGGVLPTGSVRIRNLSIRIPGPQEPITAEVRTDTWPAWLVVAQESREQAQAAREAGVAAGPNPEFVTALKAEFRASMTSLCASAFALDAFYGSTLSHVPDARIAARNRHGTILETLKRAYLLDRHQQEFHDGLRQVFNLRRRAVHPEAEFEKFVQHPIFGVGVDPRFVAFRVENADTALVIAHRMISFCLNNPKPEHGQLVEWTVPALDLLEPLGPVSPQTRPPT
jgi:hypothetical protein